MCPSILMSVLEFSSLWSVILSGLLKLTVRAQNASFSIVAAMAVIRFLARVRSLSL